jgi:hypothetical protein
MKLTSFARAVAAVAVLGTAGGTRAGDHPVYLPPSAPGGAKAGAPCGPCSSPATTGMTARGKAKAACPTKLCPEACFGYYQTQWSRWDAVCPLPYQGVGVPDSPPPKAAAPSPLRGPDDGSKDEKKPDDKKPDDKKPELKKDDVKKPGELPNGLKKPDLLKNGELPGPRPAGKDPTNGGAVPKNGTGRGTLPAIPQLPATLPARTTNRFGP